MLVNMDLENWPDCITPGCKFKSCTWLGTGHCYNHAPLVKAEKEASYNVTHDGRGNLYHDYAERLIKWIEGR